MDDRFERLRDVCAREAADYAAMLIHNVRKLPDSDLTMIPIIGRPFLPDQTHVALQRLTAAFMTQQEFCCTAPPWCIQPLPLRQDTCDELMEADDARLAVVGHYADSLRYALWDRRHPRFGRFCQGLLAHEYTPARIRGDARLRREFKPRMLRGLCGDELVWDSPENLVINARCAEHERHLAEQAALAGSDVPAPG